MLSGTGTVTTFSATSSIPGITTTVTNSTTTPNLALSITGTPASGTYLDHAGNFTTPPGSGSVGTLSQVLTQGNTTGGSNIVVSSTDNIQASGTNANLKVQGNGTGKLEVRSADTVTPDPSVKVTKELSLPEPDVKFKGTFIPTLVPAFKS